MSVIAGLEAITRPMRVLVHTDSAYVEQAFAQRWLEGWRRNGWKTAAKKPVKNRDLWERLDAAVNGHDVEFVRVKGHAGVELNERVDQLAVEQRTSTRQHDRPQGSRARAVRRDRGRLRPVGAAALVRAGRALAPGDDRAARAGRRRRRADVATGTAAVAIDLVRRYGCRVIGIDQSPEMLARGAERVAAAGPASDRAAPGRGRAASARRRLGRCPHPHLPAPLRRRPGGDAARAGAGGQARRARWPRSSSSSRTAPGTRRGGPGRGRACRPAGSIAGDGWYETGRFLGPSIEEFWRQHPLGDVVAHVAGGRDGAGPGADGCPSAEVSSSAESAGRERREV